MNAYTLKMIAIIGMVIQHAAMVLRDVLPYDVQVPMHILGGLTFPILAYFVSEGYKYTSNLRKYMGRLLIFALLAQIPFAYALSTSALFSLNILFTIALGLIVVDFYEKHKEKKNWFFWLMILVFAALSIFVQFSFMGVLMIFLFHVIKDEKLRRTVPIIVGFLFFSNIVPILLEVIGGSFAGFTPHFFYTIAMGIGNLIGLFLLATYNDERGPKMKYFFYAVYPLHFVLLIAMAHMFSIPLFFFAI